MAITQPANRNVNVTVVRNDNFPAIEGFGTPLLLTGQTVTDKLDATLRTRSYGSLAEVAIDFAASDEFYIAAANAFAQNPRPIQIKAGWYDNTITTAAELQDELDAVVEFDDLWYWFDVEADLRDDLTLLPGAIAWVEAKDKQFILSSNDTDHELLANTTAIAAANKGTVENTSVVYHDVAASYPGFALASLLGTYNFDDADSNYTAKYKKLQGFTALNQPSAVQNIVQGWTPGVGQSTAAGHCANTIVNQGGNIFLEQGSTLTPNVFIDEVHMTHWLKARTEEAIMALLLNTNAVPFDDNGLQMVGNVVESIMERADRAGLVASDVDENGDYKPAYTITVPSVFDVSAAQRKNRIAPAIEVTFRYAGALHYVTVNYTVNF